MSSDYDAHRLDDLLQRLFEEILDEKEANDLNLLLSNSSAARGHYRRSLRLHAALIRYRSPISIIPEKRSGAVFRRWSVGIGIAAAIALFVVVNFPKTTSAAITGTSAAVWAQALEPISLDRSTELISGFAEVTYRNGVRVILEGPCLFQVTSATSMSVPHGRATVKVPHTVKAFNLDTPAGRITDIGTEFGVAVGSSVEGPVILTEVFDGEIEIPAEHTPTRRLYSGEALAIVGRAEGTRLLSKFDDYRVNLADLARQLPPQSEKINKHGNIALGKPVTTPAYYSRPHGNHFPVAALTDGRLNDSGSPGDWSFWLAPNGDHGEFTVDLLKILPVARIDFQNTRNRNYGDRGLRELQVFTSIDGESYEEILRVKLSRIDHLSSPGVDFPFESFEFSSRLARYVKVIGTSHYSDKKREVDDLNHSGGLNEIRIFER